MLLLSMLMRAEGRAEEIPPTPDGGEQLTLAFFFPPPQPRTNVLYYRPELSGPAFPGGILFMAREKEVAAFAVAPSGLRQLYTLPTKDRATLDRVGHVLRLLLPDPDKSERLLSYDLSDPLHPKYLGSALLPPPPPEPPWLRTKSHGITLNVQLGFMDQLHGPLPDYYRLRPSVGLEGGVPLDRAHRAHLLLSAQFAFTSHSSISSSASTYTWGALAAGLQYDFALSARYGFYFAPRLLGGYAGSLETVGYSKNYSVPWPRSIHTNAGFIAPELGVKLVRPRDTERCEIGLNFFSLPVMLAPDFTLVSYRLQIYGGLIF